MGSYLCCCPSCKPRYQRLVDTIYPRVATDGLVSSNMQKLTFYSISHPEKLNRIGVYIVDRLARDLSRQRTSEVKVAVDAMDQLLKSCHGSPSLNQFTESYLRMVQKLLETNDPDMEKLATDLFVRFSSIEEDSPSYHRQYDFFISKFSAMCHGKQGEHQKSQRYNGLRGLRGVIWKSGSNDLQANIWEKQHMDKILPSILFNFQEDSEDLEDQIDQSTSMLYHHYPDETMNGEEDPRSLALQCLRELFAKCNFGSLKAVMEPVFKHFDLHQKWDPPATFAITTFKAILYSIQTQNSSFVIQELINHLEHMPNNEVHVRIGIATVLSSIVSIAGTTIGPLMLAIFHSLLKRLRSSVEFQQSKQCHDPATEKTFQDTLINALGDFANALPDFQKVEIMMFTVTHIPKISDEERQIKTSDAFLQKVLVKTIRKVATKYKTSYLATVFTEAFLRTILQLSLTKDSEVRLISQQIFHTLLDRHDNLTKLDHLPFIPDVSDLQLSIEKCSRQDQLFMGRHILEIISALYRCVVIVEDNDQLDNHLDSVLCSMSLLCIEVGHDQTLIELFRLAFALQALALESDFSLRKAATIHNLVAKYLNLSSQLLAIPALCHHVQQIIKLRSQKGHPRLNIMGKMKSDIQHTVSDRRLSLSSVKLEEDRRSSSSPAANKAPIAHMDSEDDYTCRSLGLDDSTLFNIETVAEALKASNKEVQGLLVPLKVSLSAISSGVNVSGQFYDNADTLAPPHGRGVNAFPAATLTMTGTRDATVDDSSSVEWSPPESRKSSRRNTVFNLKSNEICLPTTADSLRTAVNAPPDSAEEERKDQEKSLEILQMYRGKKPDELMEMMQNRARDLESQKGHPDLAKTLEKVIQRNTEWSKVCEFGQPPKANVFEMKFPSSFVK
ncbi:protein EFR3 like protein [Ditylenchus destructor]|nr:protein EFR3 like protein [Ditylenchus destructor]